MGCPSWLSVHAGPGFDAWSWAVAGCAGAAPGLEGLGAHVALGDGPLVGLLGEQGADEADHSSAVREDPDDVSAPADLLVEPFLRVVRPDLGPMLHRERTEGQDVVGGVQHDGGDVGEPGGG